MGVNVNVIYVQINYFYHNYVHLQGLKTKLEFQLAIGQLHVALKVCLGQVLGKSVYMTCRLFF